MITHLAATVARIDIGDLTVELEVAGVRYQVLVPAVLWPEIQTIVDQAEGEDEAKLGLHIIYHATTNAPVPMLIGFIRRGERVFFRKLMSVEGLGPTKAAKALTISVSSMARAIEEENRGMLTKLPGIGGRAADKIIASLKGKVQTEASMQDSDQELPIDLTSLGKQRLSKDAEDAVVSLGYSRYDAKRWVENALTEEPATEDLESLMLQILRERDVST